jgi:hypothetical protein
MFQAEVMEKIKRHILCSKPFLSEVVTFMRSCGMNCGTGQDTDSTTHAHCMLDT